MKRLTIIFLFFNFSIWTKVSCKKSKREFTLKINLEEFVDGIYFLRIETEMGVVNRKLILQ